MSGENKSRAAALFKVACELQGAARTTYLDEACGDDVALRAAVERLLAFDRESLDFLSERDVERGRQRLEQLVDDVQADLHAPDPQQVGPYRVLRRLGEGGMGIVYEAEQHSPRRRVALKIVRPTLATTARVARFRQEAELLGRLQHPGIACVYESATFDQGHGPQPYFALELVDGEDLSAHVTRKRVPVRRRLELLAEVCDAVQHAHERGVIHRDLKPENILVDDAGRTKVLDFGVARATDGSTVLTTLITEDGDLLGTIAYMAPEQVEGRLDAISPRTDVYALGVIAFELLAGRLPHDVVGLPLAAAMQLVREKDPPRLRELRPELAGDVDTLVGKALEHEPERRYASAAELAADLRAFLGHRPIAARPPSRAYRARKFVRRHSVLVGGVSATLLALTLGLVAALVLADRENDQRLMAEENNRVAQVSRRRVVGQLLQAGQERLERGDVEGAAQLHREVDEDLRGWAWDFQARVLPRLLPPEMALDIWIDARHLLVGDPRAGHWEFDTHTWRRTRAIAPAPELVFAAAKIERALVGSDEVARIDWSTASLTHRYDLREIAGDDVDPVSNTAARLTPDGRYLVVKCRDQARECIVVVDGDVRWRLPDVDANPWITPDASRVLLYTATGELQVFAALSGEPLGVVPGLHVDSVNRLRFSSDSRRAYVILAGFKRMACIDLHTFEVQPLPDSITISREFAISPDERLLATSPRGALSVVDLTSGEVVRSQPVNDPRSHPRNHDDRLAFSPDGRQLVAVTEDIGALLINLDERPRSFIAAGSDDDPRLVTYREHGSYVYHVAVSPDGRLAASVAPAERVVHVWDLDSGLTLAKLPRGRAAEFGWSRRNLLTFTPDGRELLMTTVMPDSEGVELVSWDLLTGERTRTAPAIAGDQQHEQWVGVVAERLGSAGGRLGRTAAKALGEPAWLVVDTPTDETGDEHWQPFRPGDRYQRVVAVSPDGSRVATAHERIVLVYDATGDAMRERFFFPVWSLAYSPDGRLLAAGGTDGRVQLYDTEHDVEVLDFQAHDDYIFSLAWSPVGPRIVTASGDGSVKVWDARSAAERAADQAAREQRLDLLRALDSSDLQARWPGAERDERGDLLRILVERR